MPWRVVEGIYTETIDGEMIVLDGAGNRYLSLNETGAAILAEVAAGSDIDAVVARLTSERDVPEEEALAVAEAFLRDLVERGIVEPV